MTRLAELRAQNAEVVELLNLVQLAKGVPGFSPKDMTMIVDHHADKTMLLSLGAEERVLSVEEGLEEKVVYA